MLTKHNCYKDGKPAYEKARRAALQQYVISYLKEHPCVDCGESDVVVLDFDHITGVKKYCVTRMISIQLGLKTIIAEIAKCVVRCANCHRRKTAKEQGWARAKCT